MKSNSVVRRFLVSLITLCLCISMFSVPALAAGVNSAVQDDKNGVVQVVVSVKDKNNELRKVQAGTGFLINDRTVVTCNHVVVLNDDTVKELQGLDGFSGYKAKEIRDRAQIKISVYRDTARNAKIINSSAEVDIAVLELDKIIEGKNSLPIRKSDTVNQTEECFALGFPTMISKIDNITTYTSDDVTITQGQVNKVTTVNTSLGPVDYVVASTKIDNGNSGGPLVDVDGNVIGISQAQVSSNAFDDGYFYFIAINQLLKMIEPDGIEYTPVGETPRPVEPQDPESDVSEPEPTPVVIEQPVSKASLQSAIAMATGKKASEYTDDSFQAMSSALDRAKAVNDSVSATQAEVEDATKNLENAIASLKAKEGLPMMLIIGIAGGAALIVIIILVIVLSKKKQKPVMSTGNPVGGSSMPSGMGPRPIAPPVNKSFGGEGGGTSVLGGSSEGTTVLNAGSAETTVLGGDSISYGKLTRKKTGEEINVNSQNFKMGKQRTAVDYCISDNSAVSRVHAVILSRSGSVFLKDNNSTNGTFVNGVRVPANGQSPLKSGDKIALGDEEFTYKA